MHGPNCHNELYKTDRLCSLSPISVGCQTTRAGWVFFYFVADLPYDSNLVKYMETFQWCNLV